MKAPGLSCGTQEGQIFGTDKESEKDLKEGEVGGVRLEGRAVWVRRNHELNLLGPGTS